MTLKKTAFETGSGVLRRGAGAGGYPAPAFATYYFFFAVFFFELPFFFAFFFAAIIVSFKVNLGMLIARVMLPHSHRTIFRTLYLLLFHRSPEKIFGKTVHGAAILCHS